MQTATRPMARILTALALTGLTIAGTMAMAEPANASNCRLTNDGKTICSGQQVRHGGVGDANGNRIVAHPAGCPWRQFCGCGVSVKVFGHPVRSLYLASNWLRFPRATPRAGMVAARHGHAMYIMAYHGGGVATVYDPNSGGHQTRIHERSLRGYTIVNPHGETDTYHARRHRRH